MWNVWEAGEVHKEFWQGDVRKRGHLEDLDIDKRTTVKCFFKKRDVEAGAGLIWLRRESLWAVANAVMNFRVP